MATTSANPDQPNARKAQACRLAARTGMARSAALRHVLRAAERWQPRHRWALTDDVRAWLSGESWRGIGYGDLYAWLDNEVSPDFVCDRCGEPGNARDTDCSISLIVTAYDPDLSPATRHLATKKYHAACRPSSIAWQAPPTVSSVPQPLYLPSSQKPSMAGEFALEPRALLDTDPDDDTRHAMLLLTAHVVRDHGQGSFAWLTELELYLSGEGVGRVHDLEDETDWTLRIAAEHATEDRPPWIAIRTARDAADGTPDHLLLCQLDLPEGWAETARRDGCVDLVVGPCTRHWDHAPVPEDTVDEIAELLNENDERCGCAHLTADHAVDLVESSAFLVGTVRVAQEAR
ncbi:hypothetical protein DMP23_43050 [Amycolatopsis sp. A1MSW2902]|uniref:hypothetical protein n=1 Tax=Amycolatopsis sp. A1MSW2902 TaxID=687413 RepID=UPI00307D6347